MIIHSKLSIFFSSFLQLCLFQRYISPWLFGPSKLAKKPHELVLETTQAVLRTVEQLQKAVAGLQTSLDNHSNKLDLVSQSQVCVEYRELKFKHISVAGEARGVGSYAGPQV